MEWSAKRWEKLSVSVLVHIFRCLGLNDRKNASLTCKAWNEAFRNANLWSCLRLNFADEDLNIVCCRGEVSYSVVSHCHEALKHLTIASDTFHFGSHQERFTYMIKDFFDSLIKNHKVPQLRSFYLSTITLPTDVNSFDEVDSLIISTSRFLRAQKRLEECWIMWELCTFHEALLIDAISSNSSKSMITLEVNSGKEHPPFNRFPNVFITSLRQLSNLTALILSYVNFGEEALNILADNSKQLAYLTLEVTVSFLNFADGAPHFISPAHWKNAAGKLPHFRVNFVLSVPLAAVIDFWDYDLHWQLDLLQKLVPKTVPLVGFITEFPNFRIECFIYLMNFSKSLENLELQCNSEELSCILDLIIGCPNLIGLKLIGQLSIGIIDLLEELKLSHFTDLQIVYLLFDEVNEDSENQLQIRRNLVKEELDWSFKILLITEETEFNEALNEQFIDCVP